MKHCLVHGPVIKRSKRIVTSNQQTKASNIEPQLFFFTMARNKKIARGRQTEKMKEETPQKGKEENPIELDSDNDTRLFCCTPFDFNDELENEETKTVSNRSFSRKHYFRTWTLKTSTNISSLP